ncbi:MAG: ribose 5-phosphate isomerase B [Eubacteriales bacterium]
MKIAIGNDHAAFEMKIEIMKYLTNIGHKVINHGHNSIQRTDYPIYAKKVADSVLNQEADRGILICGTGVGISIAANKIKGIRAVVCSEPYSAKLSKEHNDTNILAFGARVIGIEIAKMIIDEWLNAEYIGAQHQNRLDMICKLEEGAEIV